MDAIDPSRSVKRFMESDKISFLFINNVYLHNIVVRRVFIVRVWTANCGPTAPEFSTEVFSRAVAVGSASNHAAVIVGSRDSDFARVFV